MEVESTAAHGGFITSPLVLQIPMLSLSLSLSPSSLPCESSDMEPELQVTQVMQVRAAPNLPATMDTEVTLRLKGTNKRGPSVPALAPYGSTLHQTFND